MSDFALAREWDQETSLYYYRARYYDSTTGRFISEDPIRFEGGLNFFTYVFNRPTRMTDSSGERPVVDRYPSVDCAGWNAANDLLWISVIRNKEYAGFVYRNSDGSYSYTIPLPGDRSSVPGFWSIHIPTGTTRAGWYHSHAGYPRLPANEGFSDDDTSISNQLHKPGYLATPSQAIKKFDPQSGSTSDLSKDVCGCH